MSDERALSRPWPPPPTTISASPCKKSASGDGVIGYNLKGAPAGGAAMLIEWANAQEAPVLALDAPSGVDTTTGAVYEPAVRADATMTLALPKEGLRAPGVAPHVGELYLADISVPPSLYAEPALGLSVGPLFARDDVIRLV